MMCKPSVLVVFALSLVTAGTAAADRSDAQIELEDHLHQMMYQLNDQQVEALQEYGKCRATLAAARKAFKSRDLLHSPNYAKHPKATKDDDGYAITVADIPWICDEVDRVVARGSLFAQLTLARNYQQQLAADPPLDERAKFGDGDDDVQRAKTCAAAVAAVAATGAAAVEWKGASIAIADATALCDVVRKWGEYQQASGLASFEKIAPTYRALGVDGDRLRLFVENDGVYFRGKRCEKIEDPKALAKAKVVYQWLVNADDTHTIRKFTFTGNRYKVTEKTFVFERQAYGFCK